MSNQGCGPAEPVELPESVEERDALLAQLAKGLAHPARAAILRILAQRSACVCGELVEELPLAQSTVSQHLAQMKRAGIIKGEIDGPRVCYCIEPTALAALKALLAAIEA